ncbi:hypothetical protein RJT34_33261 [Clitoria ternatea]|uniref:non-specific serine/threonine protein kinase n=1 Tax=Clitoria ternatea TaxID=43366 RepID=A0AAN9EYZ7_CLITE
MAKLRFMILLLLFSSVFSVDFLFNSFTNVKNLTLINDAHIDGSVIRMTNDSNQYSYGRVFYPTKLPMKPISSFSTTFIFSILPQIPTSPGFGLAFLLCNTTSPPDALASQYFGLFNNFPSVFPLIAVEFDTGQNPEFNDIDDNHIGIDLNNIESINATPAGYYNSSAAFFPLRMRTGQNIRAWIDFDGENFEFNVTIAPIGISRPSIPTLSYKNPIIANYISSDMYFGFSASKTNWIEAQRVLAWSFSDSGPARDLNTTNLPVFQPESSSSSFSGGAIAGIVVGCVVFVLICASVFYLWGRHIKGKEEEEDEIEDWELEYWPHRFSYEELSAATGEFRRDNLLGSGGFGRVYRGILLNKTQVAVKCVNHDSKQGLREFMAEISSMGRLQHKNLVQMRGWCRKGNELMLVYDYMPNGSLNKWVFDNPEKLLGWEQRRRILVDVAEGLNYLHHGWDQVVIHRDVKSSNILLDAEMRGRLGDFGLAKLYQHGEVPNTTRVVGTLGYLAPELATVTAPTSASDVYSFGVVLLEVACGRRPIETSVAEEEVVLIDWVRDLYAKGCATEAADARIQGEFDLRDMEMVLKLGLACCHPDPQRRPTMKEVVALLLGEDLPEAPGKVLSDLVRGGGDDGELGEEAPLQSLPPV